MNYREKFVQKVKKLFEAETAAYKRREKAYEFITEYFCDLLEDLYDETEAAEHIQVISSHPFRPYPAS